MDPIWLQPLLDRYLGPDWVRDQDRIGIWELVKKIPNAELWRLRRRLKGLLIDEINERAREGWQSKRVHAEGVIAFGALLEPEVFTIGFARRFTGYKRPDLILHDIERLKRLPTSKGRESSKEFSVWPRIPKWVHASRSWRVTTSSWRNEWFGASMYG
jgi:starch phosphorylase